MKNPRTLLEEIRTHVKECPIGWNGDTMMVHRSTKPEDIVAWLVKLHRLTGVVA